MQADLYISKPQAVRLILSVTEDCQIEDMLVEQFGEQILANLTDEQIIPMLINSLFDEGFKITLTPDDLEIRRRSEKQFCTLPLVVKPHNGLGSNSETYLQVFEQFKPAPASPERRGQDFGPGSDTMDPHAKDDVTADKNPGGEADYPNPQIKPEFIPSPPTKIPGTPVDDSLPGGHAENSEQGSEEYNDEIENLSDIKQAMQNEAGDPGRVTKTRTNPGPGIDVYQEEIVVFVNNAIKLDLRTFTCFKLYGYLMELNGELCDPHKVDAVLHLLKEKNFIKKVNDDGLWEVIAKENLYTAVDKLPYKTKEKKLRGGHRKKSTMRDSYERYIVDFINSKVAAEYNQFSKADIEQLLTDRIRMPLEETLIYNILYKYANKGCIEPSSPKGSWFVEKKIETK
jgi:hypothetical protein